jgi:two-component system sensor histidine kinase ChvG
VHVSLQESGGEALLTVANKGPALPAAMRGRLFDSMISMRETRAAGTPHLGIGLYVARLIAEFHGGSIAAADLPSGEGVALTVRFALAWK